MTPSSVLMRKSNQVLPASLIYSAHRGWISGPSDKWRSPTNKVGPKKNFLSFLTGLWVDNRRCASDCDTWPHSCCISSNATLLLLAMTKKEQQRRQDMRHPFWLEHRDEAKKEKKNRPSFPIWSQSMQNRFVMNHTSIVSEGNKRGLLQNTLGPDLFPKSVGISGIVHCVGWKQSMRIVYTRLTDWWIRRRTVNGGTVSLCQFRVNEYIYSSTTHFRGKRVSAYVLADSIKPSEYQRD